MDETPTVKVAGVDIDLAQVADGLEAMLRDFRAKRAELDRARKAFGESQVLLDQALDEFQASFPWIAQALEAFARWAGERRLADRIRTSIRRVTRRQGSGVPGEESGQSSTGETPSEEPSADEAASEDTSPDEPSLSEVALKERASDEAVAVES